MNKPIGGRGKKAPYETTHVRIPVDLKSQVEKLVEDFRNNKSTVIEENDDKIDKKLPLNSDNFIQIMIEEFKNNDLFITQKSTENSPIKLTLSLEESISLANNLLASRGSRKDIITKLLTALYQVEVKL